MRESFLQSKEWEEFQRETGRKVWRVNKSLVIRHNLPLNKNYLYSPRGPIGPIGDFLNEAEEIARKEESIFLKIEPDLNFNQNLSGFKRSLKEIQPSKTVVLNIAESEEEILGRMHQKTRYNIRLAQKKGVEIKESNKEIDIFLKLLKQTAKRDNFYLHPDSYYRKMIEIKNGMIRLFLAEHGNKVIAGGLFCFSGQTATYLHGASDYEHRHLMAPYLLQWKAILKARETGLSYYDFYGIDQRRWPGVTRFKKGFGGKEVIYPGSFDLVYSSFWYWIYRLVRLVRKIF